MNGLKVIWASGLGLMLSACGGEGGSTHVDTDTPSQARVSSVFPTGCSSEGNALVEPISSPAFQVTGPNALGGVGDYLIANDEAAFVVTGAGPSKTYFHYPGILIDAMTLKNCEQSSADNFYELALMVVRADINKPTASRLRAFRGERMEVINDGRDGKAAVLRVYGTDDTYWLAETVLMQESQLNGLRLDYSQPFGLNIEVDYILPPHSRTLEIQYRLNNRLNQLNSITAAFGLLNAGNGPQINSFSPFDVRVDKIVKVPSDISIRYGIPWMSASDGQGTYVYGADSRHLTAANVIGVEGVVDVMQMFNTWGGSMLNAHGYPKDTLTEKFFVTVGEHGEIETVQSHLENVPSNVQTHPAEMDITVRDALSGKPVSGANVQFQAQKQILLHSWPWETFLTANTDENGRFQGSVPLISYLKDQPYRVLVTMPGRPDAQPAMIYPDTKNTLDIALPVSGRVHYQFVDDRGQSIPVQLSFWQGNTLFKRFYLNEAQGVLDIPPGDYEVGISHGWEYEVVERSITVSSGATLVLNASLKHWVDTTGFMSFDAHVHSSASPDSPVLPPDRIITAAATGLEVVVSTDHEIVTDLSPAVIASGMQDWVATVVGQEVTAALPNHTIAYPLPVLPDAGPRGQPVEWYGMDLAQIFAAEKARGAQIRTLAHPRLFVLDAIQWDHVKGGPGIDDPAGLGLPPGGTLWSWDFEAVEYMNGVDKVFSTHLFEDWMSFINHGHRITATGASDMHDYKPPGMPRNYFKSPTDLPREFKDQYIVDAVKGGQVVVSTGAFARVRINDNAGMGDIVTDSDGEITLNVHVEALPQIEMSHFKVFVNCDEVATRGLENPVDSAVKFDGSLRVDMPAGKDAHVVVLGFGKSRLNRELPQFDPRETPFFTTNPIYVDTNGNGTFDAPGGKSCNFSY